MHSPFQDAIYKGAHGLSRILYVSVLIAMQTEAAKMTQDEKPTAELVKVESAARTEGMRYIFIDKEPEKCVVRKLDFHIMPILMALCKSSAEAGLSGRRGD